MQIKSLAKRIVSYFLLCILFSAVVVAAFYPSLEADFTNWDDNVHLTENVAVKMAKFEGIGWQNIKDCFLQTANNTYQPLTIINFIVEYYFFGENPFVFHLNNLLLHLAVSLLVFAFFRRMGLSLLWAVMAALFFALHPMKVESVAWVTERKDVLYAFFYMLGIHSYLSYIRKPQKRFYILTFVFGLLSILSKAMALSFPLIIVLMDWYEGRKITKKVIFEKIPFFLIIGGIALITYINNARNPIQTIPEAIFFWTWTFCFYLQKFLIPIYLLPIYPHPTNLVFIGSGGLSVACSVLVALGLWVFRKKKYVIFGFGFYFLSMFFLLRFDGSDTHFVGDRFIYLPSVGLLFLAFIPLQKFWIFLRKKGRWLSGSLLGVLFLVLLFYGYQTFRQCQVWKNSITLWEYELWFNQDSGTPFNNLAISYDDQATEGQFTRDSEVLRNILKENPEHLSENKKGYLHATDIKNIAERRIWLFEKALALDAVYPDALYNLGITYEMLGLQDKALVFLERAVRANPNSFKALRETAGILAAKEEHHKAIMLYLSMLNLPDTQKDLNAYFYIFSDLNKMLRQETMKDEATKKLYEEAREKVMAFYRQWVAEKGTRASDTYNLAWMYEDMGGHFSTLLLYQQLLKEKPTDIDTMQRFGSLCYEIGELEQALEVYQKFALITPNDYDAYLNIGSIYNKMGRFKEAIMNYEKALQLNSFDRRAYFNLGYVYENLNENKKAVDYYQTAVKVYPQYAEAYYNMGNIYAKIKKLPEAILAYKKVLEIKPDHLNALINLTIVSFFAKDFPLALDSCQKAQALGYQPSKNFLEALKVGAAEGAVEIPGSAVKGFFEEMFSEEKPEEETEEKDKQKQVFDK